MYKTSTKLRYAPEVFADIPGYEGYYQVSNYGRVKNSKTGKILKPYLTRGYLRVSLYNESGRKYKLVHRLVAEAFLPNPDNKYDSCSQLWT